MKMALSFLSATKPDRLGEMRSGLRCFDLLGLVACIAADGNAARLHGFRKLANQIHVQQTIAQ